MATELDERALRFRRGDAVAIAIVILVAIGLILFFALSAGNTDKKVVRIYQNNEILCELPLERDAEYEVNGTYRNLIRIQDGSVAIIESNCPGEDCVHTGRLSVAGRSIVCLPNRVEVRIVGTTEEDDVDVVVG